MLFLLVVSLLQQTLAASPSAFSVPVDNTWIGYDGSWSPVTVLVGTPAQKLNVFPSTSGQELLAIGLLGCDGTQECTSLRGGLFAANESTSFSASGEYLLGLDVNLAPDEQGYYGLDTISLGDENSAAEQIVAVVNTTNNWTGSLGLGIDNTTIGTAQTSSYLSALATGGKIPSHSYGYTAGASYRLKQIPASLTLGGYDANRFEPNDATFALDADRQPVLAINSISLKGDGIENVDVLDDTEQALYSVDSTTPFLWLPESVAKKVEDALGIVYNDTLELYLYSSSAQYEKLLGANLSFAFEFSETPGASSSLSLTIPGNALTSLSLKFGFPGLVENDTAAPLPYFPIRKAANSTEYTIGRCFLQETYLTVDYERNNFSLSQAKFSSEAYINLALVDILPLPNQNSSGQPAQTASSNSSHHLSTDAIIGIGAGIIAAVTIILATIAITLIRRRYKRHSTPISEIKDTPESLAVFELPPCIGMVLGSKRKGSMVSELPAREHDPRSCPGHKKEPAVFEADGTTEIKELPASSAAVELPGSPVQVRRSSIAKDPFTDENAAPGEFSARECLTPRSDGRFLPSLIPSSFSTGELLSPSSAEATRPNVSPLSSVGGHGPVSPMERPRYTIDESLSFELKPSDLRAMKLHGMREAAKEEKAAMETGGRTGGRRFSWEQGTGNSV